MYSAKLLIAILAACVITTGCADFPNKSAGFEDRPARTDIDRGRRLILIMGCNDCHTSDAIGGGYGPEEDWLIGGVRGFSGSYGTLYPANLRLLVNEISEEEWLVLAMKMRTNSPMAWSNLPSLGEKGMRAMYRFIKSLGPKGEPAPDRLPPGVKPQTDYIVFPLPH